ATPTPAARPEAARRRPVRPGTKVAAARQTHSAMIRALASRSGHWMPDRAMARYSRAEGSTRSRADRARTRPTAHQASAQRIEPRGTCADGKQGSGIERVLGTGGRDRPGGGRMLAVDAAGASGAEEPFLGRSA